MSWNSFQQDQKALFNLISYPGSYGAAAYKDKASGNCRIRYLWVFRNFFHVRKKWRQDLLYFSSFFPGCSHLQVIWQFREGCQELDSRENGKSLCCLEHDRQVQCSLIILIWALQMSWYPYFCFIHLLFMFYCSPPSSWKKISRNNGCVRSSEISNRNIEKNSNSREIVFRYNKENILKSIILKYVIIKGDIPDPGCIFLLSKLYVRRNRIKFILDTLHLINRKFILLIIWK